jgi:hypothetical protein
VSSPTTITYLPTALGASKATLLLGNVASSGPYAWQLPQCTITSNPYNSSATGTYGLFNCIAIQNGAISAVVWFYEPPDGVGVLLDFQGAGCVPWLYVGLNGTLYVSDWIGSFWQVSTPINPGWHMAVVEEWASSTSGPYYLALYLDGQFIGQTTTSSLPDMFGYQGAQSYSIIGTGNSCGGWPNFPANTWLYFNGAIAFVALYNRVLTTGDVLAIWQGNLVSSGLVAVWYGDDYNPSNGYWVSRVGGYTGAPVTSSYPPRGCIEWNSAQYSGPTGIWSSWQQC